MIPSILSVLAAFLLLGLPIFIALSLTVFVVLYLFTGVPLSIVPQRMFAGMNNFTLMAIPFFILAAEMMRVGGLAERLIDLARVLVGGFRGGMAIASVLACVFFAAISGSAPATVATIGTIMIPALIEGGYKRGFAVGIVTTAGTLGLIIPPSITMIVYGAVTGTSIGQVFIAGFLPGLVLGGMLMIYCHVHARRAGMQPGPAPTWAVVWRALRRAGWGLGLPVVLLGGIYSGIFTPTESAAVAVVYGFLISVFIYRQIGPREIYQILRAAGLLSATLLVIAAGASAFSWLLASQGIPSLLASAVLSLTESQWALLILFNIVLLVAGFFLDGVSALIVLAPLMQPIAELYGVDPVHFGIIAIINLAIGMVTPPVGLNLFVASAIAKMPVHEVARAVLPPLGVLILGLVLITYVPQITLLLPWLFYR